MSWPDGLAGAHEQLQVLPHCGTNRVLTWDMPHLQGNLALDHTLAQARANLHVDSHQHAAGDLQHMPIQAMIQDVHSNLQEFHFFSSAATIHECVRLSVQFAMDSHGGNIARFVHCGFY